MFMSFIIHKDRISQHLEATGGGVEIICNAEIVSMPQHRHGFPMKPSAQAHISDDLLFVWKT